MKWWSVLPVVAGGVSGVVAVLVTSHWSDAHRAPVVGSDKDAKASSEGESALERRLERLERRQAKVESATVLGQPAEASPDESKVEESEAGSDLDQDERQSATEYFASKLDEHRKEAVDPEWAPAAEKSLGFDLDRVVAERNLPVRVLSVQCATVTCAVELEWASFAEATRTYVEFVHTNEYSKTCSRGLVLPEPIDHDEQYRATMLLHCEEDRIAVPG